MDQQTLMLGEHNALLKKLDEGQDAIFERLGSIDSQLAEQRGMRRIAAALWGSVGGAVIAFATRLWIIAPH